VINRDFVVGEIAFNRDLSPNPEYFLG
jgi:hypothetical protein